MSTPAPDPTAMAAEIRISIKGTATAAAAMASRPSRLPMKTPSTMVYTELNSRPIIWGTAKRKKSWLDLPSNIKIPPRKKENAPARSFYGLQSGKDVKPGYPAVTYFFLTLPEDRGNVKGISKLFPPSY